MTQIIDAVAKDLSAKLAAKAEGMARGLIDMQRLISRLIGEP